MSRKQEIYPAINLFLGAGASKPWGLPVMSEFFELLKDKDKDKFNYYTRPFMGYFEENELTDLERIFEVIACFEGTEILNKQLYKRKAPPEEVKNIYGSDPLSSYLRELKLFKRQLERSIFIHLSNFDEDKAFRGFDGLFKVLIGQEAEGRLTIFTTNYDLVVENYCHSRSMPLSFGFARSLDLNPNRLSWNRDNYSLKNEPKSAVLYKLHGSIDWRKDRHGIFWAPDIQPPPANPDNYEAQQMLIYPAMTKVAFEEPYFTAYDALQRFLDRASLAVFIGYSFRDYDCLNRIQSSLRHNPRLKLLIIDPKAEELVRKHFERNERVISLEIEFNEEIETLGKIEEKITGLDIDVTKEE